MAANEFFLQHEKAVAAQTPTAPPAEAPRGKAVEGLLILASIAATAVFGVGSLLGISSAASVTLVSVIYLLYGIMVLRKVHPNEVYLLWFVFFFMTSVTFGTYLYLEALNLIDWHNFDPFTIQRSENEETPARLIHLFIGFFTSIGDELKFILILISVAVLPQILAYVFSGAFGCATPPVLISSVNRYSILSLVKFFCGVAAFQMSAGLFRLYSLFQHSAPPHLSDLNIMYKPAMTLSAAFLLAAFYHWLSWWAKSLMQKPLVKQFKQFATRATDPDGRVGVADRAAAALTAAVDAESAAKAARVGVERLQAK